MYDSIVQCFIILLDADVGSAFFTLNAGERAGKEYLEHLVRRLLFPCIPVSVCMAMAMLGHVSKLCYLGIGTATVWYFVNMVVIVYPFCTLRPGDGYRNFSWELIGLLAAVACCISAFEAALNYLFVDYLAWTVGFTLYTLIGLIGLPAVFYNPTFEQPRSSLGTKWTPVSPARSPIGWENTSDPFSPGGSRTRSGQQLPHPGTKPLSGAFQGQEAAEPSPPLTGGTRKRGRSLIDSPSNAGRSGDSERGVEGFKSAPAEQHIEVNLPAALDASEDEEEDSTGKYGRRKGRAIWSFAARQLLRRSSSIARSPRHYVTRNTARASEVISDALVRTFRAVLDSGPGHVDVEHAGEEGWQGERLAKLASEELNEAAGNLQRHTRQLLATAKAALGAAKVGLSAVHRQHGLEGGRTEGSEASALVGYVTMVVMGVSVVGAWAECLSLWLNPDRQEQFSSWRYAWSLYLMLPLQAFVVFGDRKQSLRFNFAYLVYYAVVAVRVPDYLGHASVDIFMRLGQQANDNISRPGTPTESLGFSLDVGRYVVSMGYMASMAVYLHILRMVTRYMSGKNLFPRFLFQAQLYYYFFWYILITSAHQLDGLFWAMLVSMNVHYILVNTGVYDDVIVAMQKRYSAFYSWSSRALHKVLKHTTRKLHRQLYRILPVADQRAGSGDQRKLYPGTARIPANTPSGSSAEAFSGPAGAVSASSVSREETIPFLSFVKPQHETGKAQRSFRQPGVQHSAPSPPGSAQNDQKPALPQVTSAHRFEEQEDELMPLLYRIKLADQDSLADITSLFAVPALITVFASFAQNEAEMASPGSFHPRLREPATDTSPLLPPELSGEFPLSPWESEQEATGVYYGGAPMDLVNLWIRFGLMFMARLISSRVSRAVFSYKIRYFRLALLRKMKHTSLFSDEEQQLIWQRKMEALQHASAALRSPTPWQGSEAAAEGAPQPDSDHEGDELKAGLWDSSGRHRRDEDDAFVYRVGFADDYSTRVPLESGDSLNTINSFHHMMVDEFQNCYWYFVFVTISCAFSCFQHPDMPTRFTFCD